MVWVDVSPFPRKYFQVLAVSFLGWGVYVKFPGGVRPRFVHHHLGDLLVVFVLPIGRGVRDFGEWISVSNLKRVVFQWYQL